MHQKLQFLWSLPFSHLPESRPAFPLALLSVWNFNLPSAKIHRSARQANPPAFCRVLLQSTSPIAVDGLIGEANIKSGPWAEVVIKLWVSVCLLYAFLRADESRSRRAFKLTHWLPGNCSFCFFSSKKLKMLTWITSSTSPKGPNVSSELVYLNYVNWPVESEEEESESRGSNKIKIRL